MGPEGLEAVYRRYAPLIHSRARRLVGDEADDVVQEVFVRYVRSPPRGGVSSWFFVTTTRLCVDRLRHQARRDTRWQDELRTATGDGQLTVDQLIEARDACRKLIGLFQGKDAVVAAMMVIDGMSQEETAAAMGVSRTAVAKRLARFLRDAAALLGCRSGELARQKP